MDRQLWRSRFKGQGDNDGLTSAMRAVSFAAMRAWVARLWTSSASSAVEVSVSMMAAEVSYLFRGK